MNPARHEYWSARLPISVTSLLTPKKMHYCWKTIWSRNISPATMYCWRTTKPTLPSACRMNTFHAFSGLERLSKTVLLIMAPTATFLRCMRCSIWSSIYIRCVPAIWTFLRRTYGRESSRFAWSITSRSAPDHALDCNRTRIIWRTSMKSKRFWKEIRRILAVCW